MGSTERSDNGMTELSPAHMQEMSTCGAGPSATPSGKQLQGMCVPSQVRSQTTESVCDRYIHSWRRRDVS